MGLLFLFIVFLFLGILIFLEENVWYKICVSNDDEIIFKVENEKCYKCYEDFL